MAISPEVAKALKAHRTKQKKDKLAFGGEYENNDLVCCLQNGKPIKPSTATKRFQEVTEKAGYKVTFHQLRHAHASYLLQQGEHPKIVSERLRHSSISMTMDLYSHVAPTLQQEAADRLDDILFKK